MNPVPAPEPVVEGTICVEQLTDELLRKALEADVGERPLTASVTAAVGELCAEAHVRGLRAEEMLIILKERWRRLPAAHAGSREAVDETFARVITLCIKEYYARLARRTPPPRAP